MKKNRPWLTAIMILLVGTVSSASAMGRFTLGVKGGLNSANLRVKSDITVSTYQTYNDFIWGGFVAFRLSGLFSVQLEVLDNPKGTRLQESISGTSYDTKLTYKYTEVPLLLKLAQGQMGKLAPSLYAGPYWAKLREAKIRSRSGRDDFTEDLTGQKSTDFGLVFGLGLDYDLGPVLLVGDFRYGLGLVDVDTGEGGSLKHRVFSFMAGFAF